MRTGVKNIIISVILILVFASTPVFASETTEDISSPSIEEREAVQAAKRAQSIHHKSQLALVDYLERNGFSEEAAQYGAENCGSDWNEEAVTTAIRAQEIHHKSYDALVDYLIRQEFTEEQAIYGADNCNSDWNAEAVAAAKRAQDVHHKSYEGLIDYLIRQDFTEEQAIYGADHCNSDWNAEAVAAAKRAQDVHHKSYDGLIDYLIRQDFTEEQAVYAANIVFENNEDDTVIEDENIPSEEEQMSDEDIVEDTLFDVLGTAIAERNLSLMSGDDLYDALSSEYSILEDYSEALSDDDVQAYYYKTCMNSLNEILLVDSLSDNIEPEIFLPVLRSASEIYNASLDTVFTVYNSNVYDKILFVEVAESIENDFDLSSYTAYGFTENIDMLVLNEGILPVSDVLMEDESEDRSTEAPEAIDFIGDWYAEYEESNEERSSIYLSINDDNTWKANFQGLSVKGDWERKSGSKPFLVLHVNSSSSIFVTSDDVYYLKNQGDSTIFEFSYWDHYNVEMEKVD